MLAISTKTSAWQDTMQMRVMLQILAPGMEYSDEADLSTQVLGGYGNGAQCFGGGVKRLCE